MFLLQNKFYVAIYLRIKGNKEQRKKGKKINYAKKNCDINGRQIVSSKEYQTQQQQKVK